MEPFSTFVTFTHLHVRTRTHIIAEISIQGATCLLGEVTIYAYIHTPRQSFMCSLQGEYTCNHWKKIV